MKFLLLVHSPRSRWDALPSAGADAEMRGHAALIKTLDARGWLLDCSPLAPPEEGATVRVRDGATTVAGDSCAGGQDVLAGYYVIDCTSLDEAVEVAALIPDAATGKVDVRPLFDLPAVATGPRRTATG